MEVICGILIKTQTAWWRALTIWRFVYGECKLIIIRLV